LRPEEVIHILLQRNMLLLGLAWTNIETLTWSVQWSASLSVLFFLLAIPPLVRLQEAKGRTPWLDGVLLIICVSASAFSFSRGVLSGMALAGLCLLFVLFEKIPLRRALGWAAAVFLPAALAIYIIFSYSKGNHQSLSTLNPEKYRLIAQFSLYYLALNPLKPITTIYSLDLMPVLSFALLKIVLAVWAFRICQGRARMLLLMLWLLDLGNAALLGIGRYHTGLLATTGYRYQYVSLVVFGAMAAAIYGDFLKRIISKPVWRTWATILILSLWSGFNLWSWHRAIQPWVNRRGASVRDLVADTTKTADKMPDISFLTCEQARGIVKRFHLH